MRDDEIADTGFTLHFTPAEWRALLADADFLKQPDNSYSPRRLMGLPVEIIADHRVCIERIGWAGCPAAKRG